MVKNRLFMACLCVSLITVAHNAHAHEDNTSTTPTILKHAPIGVMGDHMHKKGEVMLSYRHMYMDMAGNRKGTNEISPATIATTEPNRFFGTPMQPATLRVVPTKMTMNMDMVGVMYAPTDYVTLMAMGMYHDKEMEHITYAGMMGTTELGRFTTSSSGLGDTKIAALIKLIEGKHHNVHLNMGVSLPTGSITETAQVLTPMNTRPTLRMPYAMQLGTGTFDWLPGVTYNGYYNDWAWGAQYSAEIRMEDENSEGYAWGDKHQLSVWGAYAFAPWVSSSLRLTGATQDKIDGIDSRIVAPVQSADPDNYGGASLDLGVGLNFMATSGALKNHRFAIEAEMPLYRNLNGPQLETDFKITAGWQFAF